MKLLKSNWYGFDHSAIAAKFKGDLEFVADICVNDEDMPSAVYRANRPNKRLGHKRYMLLTKSHTSFIVRGMSAKEIKVWSSHYGVHCLNCDDVIYSITRHDFKNCSCGKVFVDGGKSYLRVGFEDPNKYKFVRIDVITGNISDPK